MIDVLLAEGFSADAANTLYTINTISKVLWLALLVCFIAKYYG